MTIPVAKGTESDGLSTPNPSALNPAEHGNSDVFAVLSELLEAAQEAGGMREYLSLADNSGAPCGGSDSAPGEKQDAAVAAQTRGLLGQLQLPK